MATKVKGDAIKEGSIPLSALSNEVKGKIENASGANWEAQEGYAGYIKNKPFAKIPLFGYTFVVEEGNEYNPLGMTNLHYDVKKTASYIKIQFFDSRHENIIFNKTINLSDAAGSTIETFKNTHLGDFDISLFDYNDNYVLVIGGGYEELWNVSIQSAYQYFNIEEITCLNDLFIPDTVLKTTPQTLSNNDKNQALANLGIDNTKYILSIAPDNTFNIREFIDKFGFIAELNDDGYGGYIGDLIVTNKELFLDKVLCCGFNTSLAKCIYVNNSAEVVFFFEEGLAKGSVKVRFAENDMNSEPTMICWEPLG